MPADDIIENWEAGVADALAALANRSLTVTARNRVRYRRHRAFAQDFFYIYIAVVIRAA